LNTAATELRKGNLKSTVLREYFQLKGALNPNSLNLSTNRENFWL